MQLSLRPYVTTGVAIVGASVLVAAPIAPAPPDLKIPMPVESTALAKSSAEVELTSVITDLLGAFNALSVAAGQGIGGGYAVAPFPVAETNGVAGWVGVLPALTLASLQAALDNPRNIPGLASYNIYALLSAPTNPLAGDLRFPPPLGLPSSGNPFPYPVFSYSLFVNALAPIIAALEEVLPGPLSDALTHLSETLGAVIAGGLELLPDPINPYIASAPTPSVANFSVTVAPPPPRPIEDGINELLLTATGLTLRLVGLAAPLLEPILGDETEQFLTIGTLGFIGPLISGTGGFGHALQDLVDSDGLEELLVNTLDIPGLTLGGAVNGGAGPNLQPVLGDNVPGQIPPTGPGLPVTGVFAPGLINNPGYIYNPQLLGLGLQFQGAPNASPVHLITPSTTTTLQGLVGRVFEALPSNQMVAFKAPAKGTNAEISGLAGGDQGNSDDVAKDAPKRNRPLLNIIRHSLGADEDGATAASATGTSGRHRIGTPVRDLINKVVNGGRDKGDDDDNGEGTKDEPSDPK